MGRAEWGEAPLISATVAMRLPMSSDETIKRSVFYSRCRPRNADAIEIVLRERSVFIGYPVWRPDVDARRGELSKAIVGFNEPNEAFEAARCEMGNPKMARQSHNFAQAVQTGDIALVPRPSHARVYAGYVTRRFEVLNDPPWANDYMSLRQQQGLDYDDVSHLGDIAQCCTVDYFRPLPFASIPGWIRRSLLGRSTFGRIGLLPVLGMDPYAALKALMDSPARAVREWTRDPQEVECRLVESVSPNGLEHLCVALLQLEHPDEIWEHVGGSGDGGIDGVGADARDPARTVGLLQCKWEFWGGPLEIAAQEAEPGMRQVLASLLHPELGCQPTKAEFWSRRHIAQLVIKHAGSLPLAISLRVAQ